MPAQRYQRLPVMMHECQCPTTVMRKRQSQYNDGDDDQPQYTNASTLSVTMVVSTHESQRKYRDDSLVYTILWSLHLLSALLVCFLHFFFRIYNFSIIQCLILIYMYDF
ncbi:hypothetical protein BDQ12DRAFT_60702 [Crucibulum laeve]|uniref:Uncharacterized protein n=1 Tax=Crucibulum laeve TaxID=68775 RepID=A0A5C3M2Q7_9AGAR|nr:hypothetical protein BDQ12DRAFT_60702 [Crucibulum laeve]